MLKNHPKGLFVAFFSNMGERFGFYTMMAILVLFLQAKYGLSESQAGNYYSWFYFSIYALALIGGLLADWSKKYKMVILAGIIIMFAGYLIMGIPGNTLTVTLIGLFTIAFGNGLFKGNLQAVVGQMYDNPKYSKVRDNAFMIFYMGINIGAFFAPFVATGIRNWFLRTQGFLHDGSLPALCHAFTKGELSADKIEVFRNLANKVTISGAPVMDLTAFAHSYIDAFSRGYNYAFTIAAGAMVISMLVYLIFNKHLPSKDKIAKAEAATREVIKMPWAEEKKRLIALGLVFFVVIFFWMSFHQNGLTLTFFARDYTVKDVEPFTNIFFNLNSILAFIGAVAGLVLIFNKKVVSKLIGAAMLLIGGGLVYYFVSGYKPANPIAPEVFQSFNPLFIVALTFPVMGFFAWLNKRNMEPSTPKKIGIGMIIAAVGFLLILVASIGLISPHTLQFMDATTGKMDYNPVPDSSRVVPYWLISSYLTLTIAELFLSPMGLSFVSKVAPPRFQGLMQGGWLLATALGNKLLFVGSYFWGKLDLWQLWAIFIVCCLLSAAFIFSIMKRLENATN